MPKLTHVDKKKHKHKFTHTHKSEWNWNSKISSFQFNIISVAKIQNRIRPIKAGENDSTSENQTMSKENDVKSRSFCYIFVLKFLLRY